MLSAQPSAIYGLKHQSRSVAANTGLAEQHQFIVGTASHREENELHYVVFNEETNAIEPRGVFSHPPEIFLVSACPSKADHVLTTYLERSLKFNATLWQVEAADEKTESASLRRVVDLCPHKSRVRSMIWHPNAASAPADCRLVTLDDSCLRTFHMDFGAAAELDAVQTSAAVGDGVLRAGCWDPHHQHQFVSVNDRVVRGWDLRTMQVTHVLQNAHSEPILDVDFNPNRPYHFLTCGEDLLARFWDLRKLDRPLKLLGKHSHWITQARFNQSHDQLVLTAGTDGSVLLWSVVSMSSAPLGDLEDPQNEKDGDKLIKTYDEHEDSVYSVAWSAGDAWVFASLSYDGRLVVNHVPPAEKYKILL